MRFARAANCAILQAMVCWKVGKTRMIRSVEKAMAIVNFVAEQAEPVSLGRIAAALQCPSATCAHLVETLCAGHYLEKISRKDGYALGPRHVSEHLRPVLSGGIGARRRAGNDPSCAAM